MLPKPRKSDAGTVAPVYLSTIKRPSMAVARRPPLQMLQRENRLPDLGAKALVRNDHGKAGTN
jgi:hypothetical protein